MTASKVEDRNPLQHFAKENFYEVLMAKNADSAIIEPDKQIWEVFSWRIP